MNPSPQQTNIDLNIYPEDQVNTQPFYIDLNQTPQDISSDEDPAHEIHQPPQDISSDEDPAHEIHLGRKKKNIHPDEKRLIAETLLQSSRDGKLQKGNIIKVAAQFSLSRHSVSRIWHNARLSVENANVFDVSSKLIKRVGRKRVEIDLEIMKDIPLRRRTNIRSLATALGASKSTLHRRIKEKLIIAHSNPVKLFLTDENKKARLEFCLSMINEGTLNSSPSFMGMHDRIHIDEKWFYITKTSQKFYLHPSEMEPLCTCKSKRFIPKIMFLAAVARPRFDVASNRNFDGKIGIWPFVFMEPAKRSSKNRVVGTLETKPILSITKDVTRSYLIQKLLSAIKEKWPHNDSNTIFIQQDNAKPHISPNDVEFLEAVERYGLNVKLCCQPANSPDLNVLDLGFFRAIDALQHQESPTSIDDFVAAVEKAFDIFPQVESNNVFLTLQSCMLEILKDMGGNNYKIPHMSKRKKISEGQLPTCIECDLQVLDAAKEAISSIQ